MRRRRRWKNRILKAITATAVVSYLLAACCLDSESAVPMAICGVDAVWLALFTVANTRS